MRAAAAVAVLAALSVLSGCGKGDLPSAHSNSSSATAGAHARDKGPGSKAHRARGRARPRPVSPVSVAPTRRLAQAFARDVVLELADLPGAHTQPTPKQERNQEAQECGTTARAAVGGGESPRFIRGSGLTREVLSSAVAVLASERLALADVRAVTGKVGVACYGRVVKHSLGSDEKGLRIGRVAVARRVLAIDPGSQSIGIRVTVAVKSTRHPSISIPIYIDAMVLVYRQAELELYASSYVQPEPRRTEQQLLGLMLARARRSRL
jgi:hypothetical protein